MTSAQGLYLTADGTGMEIIPGAVVVDLARTNARSITVSALREAFEEAERQAAEEALDPEDVLGDLDFSPL